MVGSLLEEKRPAVGGGHTFREQIREADSLRVAAVNVEGEPGTLRVASTVRLAFGHGNGIVAHAVAAGAVMAVKQWAE